MSKNKIKISKASIVFYVASVVFLGIAAFYFYITYESVVTYSQSASLEIKDMLNAYFSNCAPFFAYAFGCYGIGFITVSYTHLDVYKRQIWMLAVRSYIWQNL